MHFTVPFFFLSLVLTRIFLMVEESEIGKMARRLGKMEYRVLQKKKKVLKDMDQDFRQEVMRMVRNKTEMEQYDPDLE
eukprot:CAMPEP_0205816360 /NCGR_PEP_ID=MMETSP0205-20121125/22613_1 /ASSEMBLY_ACC=CAM_ASM_000278 /TAXON_ID=36767 /ORGANISM="Euplotes focardii, Strain TN1" /LENGTH=77 /DNA_ID=CAMNT_0053104559 /DNA_START=266 /DNA_END=499 /DNA_ORIENTATION=+